MIETVWKCLMRRYDLVVAIDALFIFPQVTLLQLMRLTLAIVSVEIVESLLVGRPF